MALVLLAVSPEVFAQTDEIQVYDAEIADKGVFNLMIHTNFIPIGRKTPDFPGGIIPNKSVNGAAEWAYGVTDWFEQGLYLPVWSPYSEGRGGSINGFKLRELFVRPHAQDHTFFYGVNFEFSVNSKYWESRRITSEVRSIVGVHLHPVDFIFNPIVDTNYTGGLRNIEFAPATRLAYNVNDKWALAIEEYADLGPLRHFRALNNQFHEIWAVMDRNGKRLNVEAGVGFGVTAGADKLTFKLMLSRDLNSRSKKLKRRVRRNLVSSSMVDPFMPLVGLGSPGQAVGRLIKPFRSDVKVMADWIRHEEVNQKSDDAVGQAEEVEITKVEVHSRAEIASDQSDYHQKPVGKVRGGEKRGGQQRRARRRHLQEPVHEISVQQILLKQAPHAIEEEARESALGGYVTNRPGD
jgi:hypothetical protein